MIHNSKSILEIIPVLLHCNFCVFLLQKVHNQILQEYRKIKKVITLWQLDNIYFKIATCDIYMPLVLDCNQAFFLDFPPSPTPTTTRTRCVVNTYTTNWPTSRSSYQSMTNSNSVWTIPVLNEEPDWAKWTWKVQQTPWGKGGSRCWAECHRAGLDGHG